MNERFTPESWKSRVRGSLLQGSFFPPFLATDPPRGIDRRFSEDRFEKNSSEFFECSPSAMAANTLWGSTEVLNPSLSG